MYLVYINDYMVRGSTALNDAVGRTIHKISQVQLHTSGDCYAEKVLFVIITDGEGNASREYSADQIRDMIEHQKQEYGWEFIFLSANMDAVKEAGKYGIAADRSQNYHADSCGISAAYEVLSCFSTAFRTGTTLAKWGNS